MAWAQEDADPPSIWIEQNVRIPDNAQNPEPGPFSFARTPHWREPVDLVIDPAVREIWVYKPNQIGFTLLLQAIIAYWSVKAPGATGFLMPDKDSIEELFTEELKPLIKATPATNRLRSGKAWDETKDELWLGAMPILGIYSGGQSKLEKRKFRYAVGDEINLYQDKSGQPPAIPRLLVRQTTWGRRAKAIFGSKPTTADGHITRGYQSCPDKRRYFMPCWHCGRYQDWRWSQIKGFRDAPGADKSDRANWVRQQKPVFYECEHCRRQLDERMRWAAVEAGRWVSGVSEAASAEGGGEIWRPVQEVSESGVVTGPRVKTERVGLHVWSIVSAWLSMSQLAAEFIEAEGDSEKARNFRNARLALPFDEIKRTVRPSVVRDKKKLASISSGTPIVPKWAVAIYATFDTQKDWFAGVIRAWGWGFRSQLLWHGQCYSFEEVYKLGLESRFEIEGGGIAAPKALLIDSGGDRTNEVYQFGKRGDPRIILTKGMPQDVKKLWWDSDVGNRVTVRMINVHHFKNTLWMLLHDPDPTKWLPLSDSSEQYCMEMASEALVKEKGKFIWKHTGVSRNEAWDLETLQRAAAEMDNIGVQQAPEETTAQLPKTGGGKHPLDYRKWS
jgi:phage terminase large subunit GpA-like protein